MLRISEATTYTASELAALLRTIAPVDTNGLPVYIVFASTLPEDLRPMQDCWGLAGSCLDLGLRRVLQDRGEWAGRGACVVLNDLGIRAHVAELVNDDDGVAEQLVRQRVAAIALHEFGHLLVEPFDRRDPPGERIESKLESQIAAFVKTPSTPCVVPFHGHDGRFVRTLLHCIHAAERSGITRVPLGLTFDSEFYELSRLEMYRGALLPELDSFGGSFEQLRATRPPEAFIDLWLADLARLQSQVDKLYLLAGGIAVGRTIFNPSEAEK